MATVKRGRPPKEKVKEDQPKLQEQLKQELPKEEPVQETLQDPVKTKAEPVIKVLATRATPKLSQPSRPQPSGNVLVYDKVTGKSTSMSHGYAQQFVKHNKNCVIKS